MDLEAVRIYFDQVVRRGSDHIVWGSGPETHYVDPVRKGRTRRGIKATVPYRLQGTKEDWQDRFDEADRTGYSSRYPQGVVAEQIDLRTRTRKK